MLSVDPQTLDLSDAWVEGDETARWRSASAHSAAATGSSLLEVPAGCRLPRHTDSAEEVVVVLEGRAEVVIGDEAGEVPAGGYAVVPRLEPHEVRNAGDGTLRFVALYGGADVTSTYEQPVQPGGDHERRSTP